MEEREARRDTLVLGVSVLGLTVLDQTTSFSAAAGVTKRECKRRVAKLEARIGRTGFKSECGERIFRTLSEGLSTRYVFPNRRLLQ